MYDARKIADYVICYYENSGGLVSNLKLQKILYFLQAEYLVVKGKRLFEDEIEAWGCGPIIPSVYKEYSMFGSASIPGFNKTMPTISVDDILIINPILEKLRDMSSTYLTQITLHQTPWIRNYSNCITRRIPVEEIREFFMED